MMLQITGMVVAIAATVSPWSLFSSQAYPPYPIDPPASGPAGVALLHVSASIGVRSSSGIPEGRDCDGLRTSLVPDARRLAAARATRFASELGIQIGKVVVENTPPPLHPATQAFTGYVDSFGCGWPKYGKPPFSIGVHETYAVTAADFAVGSNTAAPSPAPSPRFARPIEAAPVSPAMAETISIETRGYASAAPDLVSFELLLAGRDQPQEIGSNFRVQDDTMLAPFLDAAHDVVPDVMPDTESSASSTEVNGHEIFAHARLALSNPSVQTLRDLDRALIGVSKTSKPIAFITRTSTLDSCEALEDDARRDAIDRARRALVAQGHAGQRLRLTFADEAPAIFEHGVCGPILDGSSIRPPTVSADEDPAEPAGIDGFVTIRLEFQDPSQP